MLYHLAIRITLSEVCPVVVCRPDDLLHILYRRG